MAGELYEHLVSALLQCLDLPSQSSFDALQAPLGDTGEGIDLGLPGSRRRQGARYVGERRGGIGNIRNTPQTTIRLLVVELFCFRWTSQLRSRGSHRHAVTCPGLAGPCP